MGWEDAEGHPAAGGGKRLRPALCLLAAEHYGDPLAALPAAMAVELVHNFSLVHDEIQDRDAERHHRPTAWRLYGEAQAINVGDYLYMAAIRALSDAEGPEAPRLAALRALNRAIARMIAGQWQDLAFEQRDDVTVAQYLQMAAGKSGALVAAALEMGAIMAGAPAAAADFLGRWGVHLGLAFQARDDYLGTWGDPDLTGKSNLNDLARGKKTLPVAWALEHAPDHTRLLRALNSDADAARTALEAAGAREATQHLAARLAADADSLLETAPIDADTRAVLRTIAAYMVARPA